MSVEDSEQGCGSGSCTCNSGESHDESFHPLGEDWENEMREMLDDTEYDTDLGLEMAEDAQKLIRGELTEEEFYSQHHDAVVDEFGEDDRPMVDKFKDDDVDLKPRSGFWDAMKKYVSDDNGEIDRRDVMKKMGAGAAFLGLGMGTQDNLDGDGPTAEAVDHGGDDDDEGMQYGMVIDLERCDGCLQCVLGCMEENNTSEGANWMYVFAYEDEKSGQENLLVRPCQHCTNPPCEQVCPVHARHKREDDGLVLTDYETCIGCRYCQVACPYGVNYFQWGEPDVPYDELQTAGMSPPEARSMEKEERVDELREGNDHTIDERGRWTDSRPPRGTMGKCTFCPTRQDGILGEDRVGTVACMDACDTAGMKAIHFGDMNDPESRPNRYLKRRAEQEFEQDTEFEDPQEDYEETVTPWGKLSAFKLLEEQGTQPNIIYLGNQPGAHAKQVEGPVSYEDVGKVDRRYDVTQEGTVGRVSDYS